MHVEHLYYCTIALPTIYIIYEILLEEIAICYCIRVSCRSMFQLANKRKLITN